MSLRTINTNQLEVPDDLQGTAFDDPRMIQRFEQLLDFVFAQRVGVDLHSISLGNEINAYLGNDATLWAQYTAFIEPLLMMYVVTGLGCPSVQK